MMTYTAVLRDWIPPALMRMVRKRYGWTGHYETWQQAQRYAAGYDDPDLLNRSIRVTRGLQCGEIAGERDGVPLPQRCLSGFLAATLWRAEAGCDAPLRVLDFGGGLGATYLQHRTLLRDPGQTLWMIVEQRAFAAAGKRLFPGGRPAFGDDLETCLCQVVPHVAVFRSSLQYIEAPFQVLDAIVGADVPWLLIERTPLHEAASHRIAVQRVPPTLGRASYPAWILSRPLLMDYLASAGYRVLVAEPCEDPTNTESATLWVLVAERANAGGAA